MATGQVDDIVTQMDVGYKYKQQYEKNREIFVSILKVIILCGMQNIPLRGHEDEMGNFMALIKFRAETDEVLRNYLQSSPRNATYLSPTIQNQLIRHCGLLIQAEIVRRIKAARFYTIMCDGTTDTAKTEEEAVVIRYVDMDSEKVVVQEDFLAFIEAKATTAW